MFEGLDFHLDITLQDAFRYLLTLSTLSLIWIVRSPKRLEKRVLSKEIEVGPKHKVLLSSMLQGDNLNYSYLQVYFADIPMWRFFRLLCIASLALLWILIVTVSLYKFITLNNIMGLAYVILFLIGLFSLLIVIHRREAIRDT